jgi:hypothetical protein
MDIGEQQLKSIVERAYEEGWRGYLELKSEYASKVVEEISKSTGGNLPSPFFVTTAGICQNLINSHYFYSTIPFPESTRRDELV